MVPASPTLPVLIVGAGPTGLVLACALSRHGVPFRLIDEAEGPSRWSKAQVIHARTLEVFTALGQALIAPILAEGKQVHAMNLQTRDGKRLMHLTIDMEKDDTAYPFMLNLSQRRTEQLLAEHLQRLGGQIERQVKLLGFTQDDEGVTATLQHPSGAQEEVRAAWLVGCDGSHSTVRKTLGIPFTGSTYEWRITQADVRIDWPFPLPDDEVIGFLSPDGAAGAFPLPGEHRYRLMAFDADTEPTLANFQALLDTRGPAGAKVSDPAWMVQFTLHCRMVERYRGGRAFLVGDAAHIHSPAGGQGMNTGIQDAYNLAWKLALVHQGAGRPELLDSYHAERHPVAAAVLRGTDAATNSMGTVLKLKSPLAQALRNQIMGFVTGLGFVQRRASRMLSELDIGYEQSPIVAQDRPGLWSAQLAADGDSEAPSLGDWLAFGDGPTPGERVGDMDLPDGRRLHALLGGPAHALLLFDGAAATEAGYQNLLRIRHAVHERLGRHIDVHLIVPAAQRPASLPEPLPVLLDPGGALHQRFGARAECLYLVRPDGYVGYRSQPADLAHLERYLARIFR